MLKDEMFLDKDLLSTDHDQYEDEEESVLDSYRESVRYSVKAKEKSRMAFYQLKDILQAKISEYEGSSDHIEKLETMKKECALLYLWVENFGKAKGFIHEVVKNNPECLTFQWELVYSFHTAREYRSAYQYMEPLLQDAENLQDSIKRANVKKCLEIALKVSEECMNSDQITEASEIYKEIFQGLVNVLAMKHPDGTVPSWRPGKHNSAHVLLLSEESEEPFSDQFKEFLEVTCGLNVFSHRDVNFGQTPLTEFPDKASTANVVVICGDVEGVAGHCLKEILACTVNKHQPKVFVTHDGPPTTYKSIPYVCVENLPTDMTPVEKHGIIKSLYEAIFVKYQ